MSSQEIPTAHRDAKRDAVRDLPPGPDVAIDQLIHGAMAPGFLGQLLGRLVDRLVEAGALSAGRAGIAAPVRAFSTLSLLARADLSVTEIAGHLGVTHAGVIKLAKVLESDGLVTRGQDPKDARRRPLTLTAQGRAEAARIADYMARASAVYREVFDEIGVDLFAAAQAFDAALDQRGFDARMRAREA